MIKLRDYSTVIGSFWLIAFFLSLPIVQPEELARLGALYCLAIAMILSLGQKIYANEWKEAVNINPVTGLVYTFTLVIVASFFWTSSLHDSLLSFATFALFPGFVFCLANHNQSPRFYNVVVWGGAMIIGALSLWVVIHYIFFPELSIKGRIRYPFANPNHFAAVLMLGFFSALGLLNVSNKKRNNLLLGALCLLTLISIFLLASRTILLLTIISFFVYAILYWKQLRAGKKFLAAILGVLFLGSMGPSIIKISSDYVPASDRVFQTVQLPEKQINTRVNIWRGAIEMIKTSPVKGTGFGTFYLHYPQYRLSSDATSSGLMVHNDPLQFWIEIGFLGPMLFYSLLFSCGLRMYRYLKDNEDCFSKTALPSALFLAMGCITIHSHVSFDFYVSPILCLTALVFAMWYKLTDIKKPEVTELNKGKRGFSLPVSYVAASIIVLLPVLLLQGPFYSVYYTNKAQSDESKGDLISAAHAVNKANTFGFQLNPHPYLLASALSLSVLIEQKEILTADGREKLFKKVSEHLDRAEQLNSHLALTHYYRALLYDLVDASDTRLIENSLKKAIGINPLHLASRMMLADLYAKRGDEVKRYNVLKEGFYWPYQNSIGLSYYQLMIDLSEKNGDIDLYEKASRKFQRIVLNNVIAR